MFRTLAVAAAVTLPLASAGCSDAPSTEAMSQAPTSAASGPRISGTGYTYNVPEHWGRPAQDIPGFDPDSLAIDLRDSDGFTDNVNVILSPAGGMTPQQAEVSAENELEAAGANGVSVRDRVTVSGSESAHVTAEMSINANDYTVEQFYPTDHGQTFVVTFSFSRSVTAGERAKVTDAVLASWDWTD